MARGNPDNLRAAAQRKSENATKRADTAIRQLVKNGEQITFRGVARTSGCSLDFLYSSNDIRPRIEHLRGQQQGAQPPPETSGTQPASASGVVRTLTAQITELKQRHHAETQQLKAALAAAQGEILVLRRERPPPDH